MITHGQLTDEVKEMKAYGDRVIVVVDEYRSGRECSKCDGQGHLGVICPYCSGTGHFKGRYEDNYCPDCRVGTGPLGKSLGHVPCDLCSGQGTSSIIIQEDAQKRPTTGVITAIGPMVGLIRIAGDWVPIPENARLRVGDRIIFTSFSGNEFQLGSKTNQATIRYIKEGEILGRIPKQPMATPKEKGFEELSTVGIPD